MYRITYDGLTIFDPYGNANEVVSDASMSVEVNASAYLDFTMAITHPLYDTIKERSGVVSLTWDGSVLFEGVVESIDMDIQGTKSISCVSAMDYLNDTHVRPYSTVAGEADLTAPSSVDGYFQWLIDQHNSRVLDSDKMFAVGINQGASLQQNNFIYRSSESNPTTASELTDQILDSLGGYLTMRYEDGRKVLDLYADLHTMNAQIVDFGINITDFSKTTDTTDQYTAILASGGSPEFQGGDFESKDWAHWTTHPNTPLVGDKTHGGNVASYFVSGTGEYINDSFFYSRPGRRYKATVYVKNERGSNVTIRGSYQYEQAGKWTTVNVNSSLAVENKDDQWVEFSFDFQPSLSDYTKIRPRWYFDNVGNDNNRRVYLDDFSSSQIEGDTDVSEDPIDLKQVPDGVTKYDSDMTKTDDVIYSLSAVERYGYKEMVFEDSTITDVDDLMQAAIKELNKSKDPQITLDIKAVDLALFMEGYTHLNVGDAVRVRSAIHDTDEFLMVNSITLDLQDPGQSEYVIGKAYDSLTGRQSGYLRSLNSGINSSLDQVASLDQASKDQAIQIGKVEDVANGASDKADQAQDTANNASDKADQAQNAADNAQQTADEAKDKADQNEIAISEEEKKRLELEQKTDSMIENVNSFQQQTNESFEAVNKAVDTITDQANAVSERAEEIAGLLDDANAVINRHEDEIGSLTTTITNTVDKLDNLEIGGTNLIKNSDFSRQGEEWVFEDVTAKYGTDASMGTYVKVLSSSFANRRFYQITKDVWHKGETLVYSFYAKSDDETPPVIDLSRSLSNYGQKHTLSNTWTRYTGSITATDTPDGGTLSIRFVNTGVRTALITKIKLERGTVPTDWSPAPEDLESIADEALTVSTEVKQTAEEIRVTAESAYSNANEALTQSSEAVQTANSIKTTLEQNYSTTDELEQTFASKSEVEQTATSIKSEVSQTYATKSSLEALQNIADSAIQIWTGNGIPTLSKPPASDWTTTELKQQHSGDLYYDNETGYAFRFGSSDGANFSWGRIADSDITKALADAAKAQKTAEGAIDEVEQLKIDIPGTYATKTEVTQTANSIRSEVSANYTTKETFENFAVGGTNLSEIGAYSFNGNVTYTSYDRDEDLYKFRVPENLPANSFGYGLSQKGSDYVYAGIPWNEYGILSFYIYVDRACSINVDVNTQGFKHATGATTPGNDHDAVSERKHSSYSIPANQWTRVWSLWKNANTNASTGNPNKADLYDNSSIGIISQSEAVNVQIKKIKFEKGTKPTDWSPCPSDVASDISDASGLAQSALDKSTTVEQDLNGFRTTVSETYTTKTEFENLKIGSTNLILNSKPDSSGEYFFKNANSVVAGEYAEITLSGGANNKYPHKPIPLGSYTFYKSRTDVGFDNGDEFVFSFDYMITARTNASKDVMSEFWIGIRNGGNGYYSNLITADVLTAFTTSELNIWQRYSRSIKVSGYRSDVAIHAAMQCNWKTGEGSITFRLRNVKLERGTKSTDWSPAPEDIDENFSDLADIVNKNNANTASLIQSSIEQAKNSIISQVSASYYTKTEAEELMAQMSTQFQQTENSFEMQFNSLRAIVDQVNKSADTNYSNIQKYIRFVDGHIVIGVEGNPFSLDIGNDRISFMQNNSEIAYISNHEFYITSGIITKNLRIGNFEFRPRSNGNLSLSLATRRAVI